MPKVCVFLVTAALLIAGTVGCVDTTQNLEIRDWYDLDAIRDNLSGNYTLVNDLDSTTAGYTQLASPTANQGKGWQPIGFLYHLDGDSPVFRGTFDGQGYEIRDLFINRPDEMNIGLFGFVGVGSVIENVGVANADVTGMYFVGGLVGANGGTVSNSHFTGNVEGTLFAGGLVGYNGGAVNDSYSTGSVTGNTDVGGLVGGNDGTVSNSYSTGSVTGDCCVGGVVAFNNEGTVSYSYFAGTVTGNSSVGGLVGNNRRGVASNSYYNYDEVLINGDNIITIGALFDEDFDEWLANDKFLDVNERLSQENGYYLINDVSDFKELLIFGEDNSFKFRLKNDLDLSDEPNFYIPYLAGEFDGNRHKISNLSLDFDFVSQVGLFGYLDPSGRVTQARVENININGAESVGGLVGWNLGTVSSSYSSGNVTGDEWVGGLVGLNTDYATVSNSYSTASVTGNRSVGGLVGCNYEASVSNSYSTGSVIGDSGVGGLVAVNLATVSNSFWDTQTSGQSTSDGGTGKTTAQMKSIATFSGAGWDIIAVALNDTNPAYIWNIVNGVTYPFLSWEP